MQTSTIELPAAELATEVAYIRSDFKGWMRDKFDLHPNQEHQLEIMPDDFAQRLANAIADHYEQRVAVQFYKETRAEDDNKDLKDLILNGMDQVTYTLGSEPSVAVPELAIWIRYKRTI
ncbi:hypothetical protein [Sphingobacterium gobiense]|uniref:hypothetical protein n=1 Tax=Sphingobacterium gobiense TaxID=1382456 RepID=UPI0011B06908|nr:hypothetical protein [Sphingobacterium gobiense]